MKTLNETNKSKTWQPSNLDVEAKNRLLASSVPDGGHIDDSQEVGRSLDFELGV